MLNGLFEQMKTADNAELVPAHPSLQQKRATATKISHRSHKPTANVWVKKSIPTTYGRLRTVADAVGTTLRQDQSWVGEDTTNLTRVLLRQIV